MSRKETDWESIERDYRAGLLSVREIAAENGVSHVAIGKRAKRDGWERDLSAKIKAKAEALVTSRGVTTEVTVETQKTERQIIEANAEVIANVRLSHRKDITRSRNVVLKLLDELESQTDNRDLFDELGEIMRTEDDKGQDKRNDLYMKVISLPSRTKTMKDLSDSLKTLVGLERQAYGLDGEQSNSGGEDINKELSMTDIARRLAFIMTKSMRETNNG
ncbi:hypothetical protein [Rahnella bonaserana]